MQEHKESMNQLIELFSNLTIVGFSQNIVKEHIANMKEKNTPIEEKQAKKQTETWESELFEVQKEFYEFCKSNKTEYFENKDGLEVFKVNGFYFGFTFGKNMIFSIEFSTFEKYFDSKIVEIDR